MNADVVSAAAAGTAAIFAGINTIMVLCQGRKRRLEAEALQLQVEGLRRKETEAHAASLKTSLENTYGPQGQWIEIENDGPAIATDVRLEVTDVGGGTAVFPDATRDQLRVGERHKLQSAKFGTIYELEVILSWRDSNGSHTEKRTISGGLNPRPGTARHGSKSEE